MTYLKNSMAIAAIFCALALPAHADDTGFFLGGGYAATDFNDDDFNSSIAQLGLRGGYMFTDNFGIDLTTVLKGDDNDNNVKAESGMFALSGSAKLPLGDYFDLYGKLGAARVLTSTTIGDIELSDESSTELYWGLGGKVDFGVFNIFLEYNRFDTDHADINTAMLGILFEF